jgi:protoporphyrin/coproporphyrin ferrochelatase
MTKRAVVLLNLGGPDRIEAVAPFLFNLFYDPAVIGLPRPLRWPVAKLAAMSRAKMARGIYQRLGGGSPLLPNTEAQARALESKLGPDHRVFIAMRYWHPLADETAAAVKAWGATEILLLPLYPQFSTTTTASSFADWKRAAARAGLDPSTRAICCYPEEPDFVAAIAGDVAKLLRQWRSSEHKRILFSAHGLPERIVAKGDPYPWQVERTVAAIRAALAPEFPGLDSVLCYQSRVGPLKWIGPLTDDEIRRAGAEHVGLIVVPVAFVSEHSETLIELDLDYKHLAGRSGVPTYLRAPTVSLAESFIAALARLVDQGFAGAERVACGAGSRLCPSRFSACPCGTIAVR